MDAFLPSSQDVQQLLFGNAPQLLTMLILIGGSSFFSASEAALFYLRAPDVRSMQEGNRGQRTAAALLDDPDRLLSAVLFWNLIVNMLYFALAVQVSMFLEGETAWGTTGAIFFGSAALMSLIFFSEMIPKSVAVLSAKQFASFISFPLAFAVRLVDPVMPVLRMATELSRRVLWPNFKAEPHLEISDLERAIELSTGDANLVDQEKAALRNIILLSDIQVDEWMRPRNQFQTFYPPVSRSDLGGAVPPGGYMLVGDPVTHEVTSALHLENAATLPENEIESLAKEVVYVPWCSSVADVLQRMRSGRYEVAAIINEYGETIGVVTQEDVLDTVFDYLPSRSKLLMDQKPIHNLGPQKWLIAGVTSLRHLARYLGQELPASKNVTVAGVLQEQLGRLVQEGDVCHWGPFRLIVLEVPHRGHMLIEMHLVSDTRREPTP
ncbi:MAG: CNNM domain-containing protein [Pirellulaceae bacterium]